MTFKTLNGMIPENLRSRFAFRDHVKSYHLRNIEKLRNANYLKRSFSYSGAQIWNRLPLELRQATSLNDFKTKSSRHSFMLDFILFAISLFNQIFHFYSAAITDSKRLNTRKEIFTKSTE